MRAIAMLASGAALLAGALALAPAPASAVVSTTGTGSLQCPTAGLSAFDQLLCSMLRETKSGTSSGGTREPSCSDKGVICVTGTAPKPRPQPKCGDPGFHCQTVGGPGRPTGSGDPDARPLRDEVGRGTTPAKHPAKPVGQPAKPKEEAPRTPRQEKVCREIIDEIFDARELAGDWLSASYEAKNYGLRKMMQAIHVIYTRDVDSLKGELKTFGCTFPKPLPPDPEEDLVA